MRSRGSGCSGCRASNSSVDGPRSGNSSAEEAGEEGIVGGSDDSLLRIPTTTSGVAVPYRPLSSLSPPPSSAQLPTEALCVAVSS